MSKFLGTISEPNAESGIAPELVREQLQRLLVSPAFLGSKRSQQFLQFVCEKSLAGQASLLKERTIAVEVFGRHPDSDLGEDTIVRVSAREVRKRLAQYYSNEKTAGELRIDLPSGAYAPEFRSAAPAPVLPEEPQPVARVSVLVEAKPQRNWTVYAGIATIAAVVLAAAVWLWSPQSANARAFQKFWEPVINAREPLLTAVAHPIVYHPSSRAQRLSAENLPPQEVPAQRPLQVPANQLDGSDLIPVFNQYVGFGDLVASTEVSGMLGRLNKPVRVRMANAIEFADLRSTPALLIGAITNRWTMELQRAWRFRFDYQPGAKTVIVDTAAGSQGRQWTVPARSDGSAPEDYLLVSRIHSNYTGGLIIVAAGVKQFGTEAAGRLLADREQLGSILRKLPPGWESQSVQLVLHARVIGNTPAQPEVVATHVW